MHISVYIIQNTDLMFTVFLRNDKIIALMHVNPKDGARDLS
jgi:hypothetical protein